jgi:hypothetical protein
MSASGPTRTFLLGGRTSASAECRHWFGRAVRWSSCAILHRIGSASDWGIYFAGPGQSSEKRPARGLLCPRRNRSGLHGRTFDRQEIYTSERLLSNSRAGEIDTRTGEAHSLKKPLQRSIPRWAGMTDSIRNRRCRADVRVLRGSFDPTKSRCQNWKPQARHSNPRQTACSLTSASTRRPCRSGVLGRERRRRWRISAMQAGPKKRTSLNGRAALKLMRLDGARRVDKAASDARVTKASSSIAVCCC